MSAELMGFRIDTYTLEESVKFALELANSDKVSQVVTINPEMINFGIKNDNFAKIVQNAELVIPDGIGIKIALLINGCKVSRVPGIDFAYKLLEESAKAGIAVAIIGAKEEIINKAVDNLQGSINNLNIVYKHNGYFDDNEAVYSELKQYSPKIVLVAMGSPKQEEFINGAKKYLSSCLMVGIGGSLDVWSGVTRRAPVIFQKFGMEWLYRTVTQPERFKRIFPALPLFLIKAVKYKYKR